MKLWLDDERPMPAGYDLWATTVDEAVAVLKTRQVDTLSLDYDLGLIQSPGIAVIDWMRVANIWPKYVFVHSQNPYDAHQMVLALKRYAPGHVVVQRRGV